MSWNTETASGFRLFISIHDALSSTRVNGERPRVVYLHYTDAYGQADRSTMTRVRF